MFYPYKKSSDKEGAENNPRCCRKRQILSCHLSQAFFCLKMSEKHEPTHTLRDDWPKKVGVQWWRHVLLPPLAFDIFTNFAPQTLSDGHDVKLKLFWLIQGLQGGAGEGPPSILCTCTYIVYTSKFISIPHWVLFNKGMMTLKLGVMTFIFPTCSSSSTPPVPLLKLLLYSASNSTLE